MPFQSQSQWRACYARASRRRKAGLPVDWDCKKWSKGVNYHDLPKYTKKKKTTTRRKKTTKRKKSVPRKKKTTRRR